jgi:hypothetical protein
MFKPDSAFAAQRLTPKRRSPEFNGGKIPESQPPQNAVQGPLGGIVLLFKKTLEPYITAINLIQTEY